MFMFRSLKTYSKNDLPFQILPVPTCNGTFAHPHSDKTDVTDSNAEYELVWRFSSFSGGIKTSWPVGPTWL